MENDENSEQNICDVSSDDLPVVSVMPAMTLHEVEDMDEESSSYHAFSSEND